ncbi:MAG: hypothetical protein GXX96_26700 [Planctomycetaceae bacterium]|nr:hypothetical protein [Planctomycetaceae bacterium]
MNLQNVQNHLEALREFAEQAAGNGQDAGDLKVKKVQLQAVQKTIRQLERRGIPVPDGLKGEKLSLATAVGELENDSGKDQVYEALLDIVEQLGRACGRRPHHELYIRSREWKRQTTTPEALRKEITRALEEMGGSSHEREVMAKIEARLKGKFTEADLERPKGNRPRWQTNVRRERRRMIEDGILTPESRRSTWTLAK